MLLRTPIACALTAALFVAGCTQPAAPGGAAPQATAAATPAPKPEAKPAPAPKPAPKPAAPATLAPGTRLVKNGEMEEWTDGMPVGWQVAGADTVASAKNAHEGKASLALLPREDNFTVAQQRLRPVPGGTKMQVHCIAQAPHVGAFVIKLQYKRGGKIEEASAAYGKHHAWGSVGFDFEAPADADPASYTLQLVRGKGVEGDVLVDAVSIITK